MASQSKRDCGHTGDLNQQTKLSSNKREPNEQPKPSLKKSIREFYEVKTIDWDALVDEVFREGVQGTHTQQ